MTGQTTHSTTTSEMSRAQLAGGGLFFLLIAILNFVDRGKPVSWPFGSYEWAPQLFMVGEWTLFSIMMFHQAFRRDYPSSEPGIFGTIWGFSFLALFVLLFV